MSSEEIEQEKYCKELKQYIIENNVFDDEDDNEAEYEAGMLPYYIHAYNPKCLIETIIDVDNLTNEFAESYEVQDRNTQEEHNDFCQGLEDYILNIWKEKGSVRDEEDTRGAIRDFTLLLCNYGYLKTISIIIELINLCEEFDEEFFIEE